MDDVLADDAGDRRNIDNDAATRSRHLRHEMAASEKRPGDVDGHQTVPGVEVEGVGVAAAADAGIVDEYIGLGSGGSQFRPSRIFGHIQTMKGCLAPARGNLLRLGLPFFLQDIRDDNVRAF